MKRSLMTRTRVGVRPLTTTVVISLLRHGESRTGSLSSIINRMKGTTAKAVRSMLHLGEDLLSMLITGLSTTEMCTTAEAVRSMLRSGEIPHTVSKVAFPVITFILIQMGQPDLREVVLDCRDVRLRTRTLASRWICLAVTYPQNTSTHTPRINITHFALKLNTDSTSANTVKGTVT